MGSSKQSPLNSTIPVEPNLRRPRNAEEGVPEAPVPDVIGSELQPGAGEAAVSPGRWQRIQQRAYDLAQRREFSAGAELDDWLQAETEIDAAAARKSPEDQFTG